MEGLQRGASKAVVYNPLRIQAAPPTRLFVDAQNTHQWREKGFFPVIDETPLTDTDAKAAQRYPPDQRLQRSLLYQMLYLKQRVPQPLTGKLDRGFSLGLERKASCPTLEEFADFASRHPQWGMPYAMPNLPTQEYRLLVQWLAQGSPDDSPDPLTADLQEAVKKWEDFFNQSGNRAKLVSRYIYEHLFQARLYFEDIALGAQKSPVFFRLVRSRTPSGVAIDEIATRRPYHSPGESPFFYRLRYDPSQPVIKNHRVYALSQKRMRRYRQLFFDNKAKIAALPAYDDKLSANPLKTFKDLDPVSRYRFLLDDAHFFIEGFIKGPVCRGQVALNVIEDYFWVLFINPDQPLSSHDGDFLEQNLDYFDLPAQEQDTLRLTHIWTYYWKRQKKYIQAKIAQFRNIQPVSKQQSLQYLWRGNQSVDGTNPAAALTVFRHFDSASVAWGLLGDAPETAWILDYPIFERIHYLLVAGFDVYGNLGHQLLTRLYMDFLRMEAEDNFLAFLPVRARKPLRDSWYQGIRENLQSVFDIPMDWLKVVSVYGYQQVEPQAIKKEFYQQLKSYFQPLAAAAERQNYGLHQSAAQKYRNDQKITKMINSISGFRGDKLRYIPDVSFLRIQMPDGVFRAFTIINHRAYKNLNSLFSDGSGSNRDYASDQLMMLDWLEGAYPNFFLDIQYNEIEQFLSDFAAIENDMDYEKFVSLYGVRRTRADFWQISDWFYQYHRKAHPLKAGYFDLNRYANK